MIRIYISAILLLSAIGFAPAARLPVENDSTATGNTLRSVLMDHVKISGSIDMQVDKELYDELSSAADNRFTDASIRNYRKAVDDFWMRVGMRMSYTHKYVESAFAFRFYPYWMMRRKGPYSDGSDLDRYLDLIELNQAYIKPYRDFAWNNTALTLHFKVGRDGLLNSCSHLFGNYLDLATGGYGDSRYENVTGPFKNRKVFANQLEFGTRLKVGNFFSARTSAMLGGNMNNDKWYSAPSPRLYQQMDSKLSSGFMRFYVDLYTLYDRIHVGAGYRNYFTKVLEDATFGTNHYECASWAFDISIIEDLKFYSEFAFQKIGPISSKTIIRPVNMGITIPTGKVLDTLAVEFENVAETFFSDKSRRDRVGGRDTKPLAWGIVAEKRYAERISVAWGLYSGNPSGDMKTSLRLSSSF